MQTRVVVGLSGGVDSAVAAALLLAQGYQVEAVYLECYSEPGCRTDQDKRDALQVALQVGISFQVLDFRKEYRERVIEYFYTEYAAGRTPNPDIMCNREIKFGIFYDWAMAQGYDYVATGHYGRIVGIGNQELGIRRAKDESKDQSYFLSLVPRDHLRHILFPLGDMLKTQVRAKARELKLPTAGKPDSMGICFIGDVDVHKLLSERLGEQPGEVVRKELGIRNQELVVGRHKGLWFYTIGQRGGWEMFSTAQKPDSSPLYVIGKDNEGNRLIVGEREEAIVNTFGVQELGIRNQGIGDKLWVRIRNLGEMVEVARMQECMNGQVEITTVKSIFAPASGQSAVFYDVRGVLAGSGIIV